MRRKIFWIGVWIFQITLSSPTLVHAAQFGQDTRTVVPEQLSIEKKSWSADLDIGTKVERGNVDQNNLSTDVSVFKKFDAWTAYLIGDWRYTAFREIRFENRGDATARLDYSLSPPDVTFPRWRMIAFSTYAFNQILALDYRVTSGVGPWVDLNAGDLKNGLSLVPVYTQQNFMGYMPESRWSLSFRYMLSLAISETARVGWDFFYVPVLSDFSDKRVYFSPYIEAFVWKKIIGLKFKLRTEYDSRPKGGRKTTDSELISAVSFHLGE